MPSLPGTQRIKTERLVDHLVIEGLSSLPDLDKARGYLDHLSVLGGDRAVFATCVLTLELALLKDPKAREDLPNQVDVLLEAFADPRLANVLVAGIPELEARWLRIKPVVGDFVALRQGLSPVDRQPTEPSRADAPMDGRMDTLRLPDPANRGMPRLATPTELIEEIQEILEEEPSLPPPPPDAVSRAGGARWTRPALPSDEEEQPLSPETRSFWAYAEKALGRVPDPEQSVVGSQSFAASRGADRSHLMRFAHDLLARFPSDRHARSLASLTLLYVAGQEKERGLLGINKERVKLISTGLSLIGERKAASQVAVLFEADGPETRRAFAAVVDIIGGFLAFCCRERLDPKDPAAIARFTTKH